jgi:hypothetical protein
MTTSPKGPHRGLRIVSIVLPVNVAEAALDKQVVVCCKTGGTQAKFRKRPSVKTGGNRRNLEKGHLLRLVETDEI